MTNCIKNRTPLQESGYFLDSGDLDEIKKWREVIGGVTTNQRILFEKQGIKNVPVHLNSICKIVGDKLPVSIELPDSDWPVEKMFALAMRYHEAHPSNTVIKVPILPDNVKGLKLIHKLATEGVRTNATIGINFGQLTLAAEAARAYSDYGVSYISLFWGRAIESFEQEKRGLMPQQVLEATLKYLANHNLCNTRIIIGSIRKPEQIIEAFSQGADIVTVPPAILEQLLFNKKAQETIDELNQVFRKYEAKITL